MVKNKIKMLGPAFFARPEKASCSRWHADIWICVRFGMREVLVGHLPVNFAVEHKCQLPLAEGVQTGQDLGVAVVIQTDTADEKLLVYLTHHWAGAPSLMLCHGRGHLKPRTATALNLQRDKDKEIEDLKKFFSGCHPLMPSKLTTSTTRNQS